MTHIVNELLDLYSLASVPNFPVNRTYYLDSVDNDSKWNV